VLRADLRSAGISFETVSGVYDFHSLRGVYMSNLVAPGASVKTCQLLARHSTPSLTIWIYPKASLHDIMGAVEGLPDLTRSTPSSESAVVAPAGTDSGSALTGLGLRAEDELGRKVSDAVATDRSKSPKEDDRKALGIAAFGASRRNPAGVGRAGIEPATPGFSGGPSSPKRLTKHLTYHDDTVSPWFRKSSHTGARIREDSRYSRTARR
jgi:hypothetical protein